MLTNFNGISRFESEGPTTFENNSREKNQLEARQKKLVSQVIARRSQVKEVLIGAEVNC